MRRTLLTVAFAALVVGSGYLHGLHTNRWGGGEDLDAASRRADDVPLEFGDWKAEKRPLDARDLARAGIKGHLFATYKNSRTRATMTVLLVCGRSGPISVHTPDVCYEGAGYHAVGSPEPRDVKFAEGDIRKFTALRFERPERVGGAGLDIYWAWNAGDGWKAPDNPRLVFARHRVLYKLYVVREVSPKAPAGKADPQADFLKSFLPEVDRALFPRPTH